MTWARWCQVTRSEFKGSSHPNQKYILEKYHLIYNIEIPILRGLWIAGAIHSPRKMHRIFISEVAS